MSDSCVCEFLKGASVYSVQYLGWVTAIVAAILALTSIVFSQFNERSIQKSNDLARSVKSKINMDKESISDNMVKEDFSQMLYLLSNTSIYDKTMKLFKFVSYFIVFLWWFSLIGYLSDADTLLDKVLIYLSTLLISIPFIYLPDILKAFNNSKPLLLNKYGKLDFIEIISFFKKNTDLKESEIISKFLNPKINIKLVQNKIYLNYNLDIQFANITCIVNIENEDNRIMINLHRDSLHTNKSFYLLPMDKEEHNNDDTGLYKLLKSMIGKEANIYICNPANDYFSFRGKVIFLNGELEIVITNQKHQTLDLSFINMKDQLAVYPVLGDPTIFKLAKRE